MFLMFILAHLAMGLLVGKLSGNYGAAIAGAMFIDLDHLIPYIKHRILFSPKKLWKTITGPKDPYGNQRNFLHSILTGIIVSAAVILVNFGIGIIFALGYLSHLLLDLVDGSDFYPFHPVSRMNIKGPIGYFSKSEAAVTAAIFVMFLVL